MSFPVFRLIVGTETQDVGRLPGALSPMHNPLLNYTPGVDGIKDLYRSRPGRPSSRPLSATRDRIIVVMLNAPSVFLDSIALILPGLRQPQMAVATACDDQLAGNRVHGRHGESAANATRRAQHPAVAPDLLARVTQRSRALCRGSASKSRPTSAVGHPGFGKFWPTSTNQPSGAQTTRNGGCPQFPPAHSPKAGRRGDCLRSAGVAVGGGSVAVAAQEYLLPRPSPLLRQL